MDYAVYIWLALFTLWLFAVGCAVGSFLNVCIHRLPRGQALTWPSSRCGACLTAIRLKDNVPLLSYLRLRGRCRACGARFSMRYFWVEALTGALFAGLYWLEVGLNWHGLPVWADGGLWHLSAGLFPPHSWPYYLGHVLLASLLVVALACLAEAGTLPRGVVAVGFAAGLLWAMAYPWPAPRPRYGGPPAEGALRPGFVPWPIWGPSTPELPGGTTELGLLTGLAGALGGAWLLRGLGAIQRHRTGRDHLSLASGVVVIAGGFLGWQPMLAAVALASVLTLARRRRGAEVFATELAVGTSLAWLGWPLLSPVLRPVLFDPLGAAASIAAVAALAAAVTWPAAAAGPPSDDLTAP